MDLNHFYFQHQKLLMRATASTSQRMRARHLVMAQACAESISAYQLGQGASAASDWANPSTLPFTLAGHIAGTEPEYLA
ncbi:hypothetical protein [Novosphingobium taihuense]|uniref:Uncharacterized protein n=1 Tax=Novosphingobium taihuense TaxID=260085 RepID=A0A7W7ESM4_9SPHN|nr:hypothetical protein [Novosphingobium taihuense]MBB4612347.1 hypothetical protein [Novosphingobium taihuense]TWH88300.1 hypothetical protein IQ25_00418 [Novosphingobium taihuense]